MFLFVPYKVDVKSSIRPFANYLVMIVMLAVFALQQTYLEARTEPFVLTDWSVKGLFGYMWLHNNYGHIIGNLIFIWVFGNAVCSKVGNIFYLLVIALYFRKITGIAQAKPGLLHLSVLGGDDVDTEGDISPFLFNVAAL